MKLLDRATPFMFLMWAGSTSILIWQGETLSKASIVPVIFLTIYFYSHEREEQQ